MTFVIRLLGKQVYLFFYHIGCFGDLFWQTIKAFGEFKTYASQIGVQMMRIGIQSIPIVIYIAAFAGMVTAIQSSENFDQFAPPYLIGFVVEKGVLRELAAVLTALVLAGRVGASIAAEIGTMRVTEQIDALETLAFNPISYLIVPRVMAGTIMFPVLTVFAALIGVIAGWLASLVVMDVTTFEFFKGTRAYFDNKDVILPMAKSILFGAAITMVACYQGFNSKGGAEGVGSAATKAAVISCLLVLFLDFLIAALILFRY
ncbi:ABC transporter permease [candidate division KSB1 bacterium]|nr:ABC transporter permease [candidate division KSB1 bacterium]NIR71159.1 ABC transporter permease [candidate division KSB1 bacterium]NIS23289.1 ABC transporter permease [candidate division KSB1 bacterium]NIT70168.1 ABC transporter permease [candidate division KSB1 bacterium]NIU23819.1 ABC transporter permease [candidate division KSB1 bacterium]